MGVLTTWWAWIAIALVFGILEVLAPVFVFLGLAAGAVVIGGLLLVGVDFAGSLTSMFAVYALLSLVATLGLRFVLGTRRSEVRTFTDDINE